MYILYLTTNLVNSKIYIGIHKTETPYKFDGYLGNGVWANHPSSYMHPKFPFAYAVKKYGPKKFIRRTIKVCDTLEEIKMWEALIVDQNFISRSDTYNAALGGDIPPISNKRTLYQYNIDTGEFIKEWFSISEAMRAFNCSNSALGKAAANKTPSFGYLWSFEKFDKVNVEDFKFDSQLKKVYLYNGDGTLALSFNSTSECKKYFNTKAELYNAIIYKNLYHGYYVSYELYDVFPIPQIERHKGDKIYQYEIDGTFVKEWESQTAATKFYNLKYGAIGHNIKMGQLSAGYQWSWTKVDKLKDLTNYKNSVTPRRVGKYDDEGNLIEEFPTVSAAQKNTPGATHVLSGKRKHAGGYVWKYLD